MTGRATVAAEEGRVWFDYEGAARYCGMHVTTLWRAVKRGELKAGGPVGGRSVRFERSELDRWLRGEPTE